MTSFREEGCFEPIHEAHAIEQVAFIVEFDCLIDDILFNEIKDKAKKFQNDLPGISKIERQGLSIPLERNGSAIHHPPISMGIVQKSIARDGSTEAELRIERSRISFLTTRYTRWEKIWENANQYLNELLPIYLDHCNLVSIGLNYIDKFVWRGHPDNCNPKLLIKEDSKYICKHIFDTSELWHSHTGVFIPVDKLTKRLLNINVNYLDETKLEEQRRVISIMTMVTDQFNQPNYEPYDTNQDSIKTIENHMISAHDFSKVILSQIITDSMSRRIALTETT